MTKSKGARQVLAFIMALALALSLVPAISLADDTNANDPYDLAAALAEGTYAWELSSDETYYALKGVDYETVITNESYQELNYYVPAGYVSGIDETTGQLIIDENATINGYTAATAPIIFENNNSAWKSGAAKSANTSYIAEGYIDVGCGSRSRDATDENGNITGKAPMAVVDLKAGVRYIRYNADILPGDMDKIVSLGGSGAGQMSSILGASGDMAQYYPYLYETGAVGVEYDEITGTYTSTISDAIYATMAYCPIADINNADLAYAWMRYDSDVNGSLTFTEFQDALEVDLAYAFCEYINSLNLKDEDDNPLNFDVDENGDIIDPRQGSYYDKILENISDSLNMFAENTEWPYTRTEGMGPNPPTTDYYSIDELFTNYTDIDEWLVENEDGTYSITSMAGFLAGTGLSRNKDIPGFDTLENDEENTAFGTPDMEASHYSASVAAVLEENYEYYSTLEGFDEEQVDLYIEQANDEYVVNQAYLMNATQIMLNVANGTEDATPSPYWRTRNGTRDEHTSFTIAYDICLAAMANDYDVDYSLVWDMVHGSNEGSTTGTFIDWVNEICAAADDSEDDSDPYDLAAALAKGTYAWVLSDDATYYALKGVNFETVITNDEYQEFNYYVPAGYVTGIDETTGQLIIDEDATINGYTAATAPIIFENNNGAWKSGKAVSANTDYLEQGFIHVGCGSRSRNATNEDGTIITGKAPMPVVDLKAGVRYLRYNEDVLPGDMDKIVSEGGSGAGQMSSILGASGDMAQYYPYLYETGAVGVEYDETTGTYTSTISDAIYATMAYCPIADINNADLAYAWMRYDSDMDGSYTFSTFQEKLEKDLAYAFCEYINSLNLEDENGNALNFDIDDNGDIIDPRQGSYYDKILENISDALNLFVENTTWPYTQTVGTGPSATYVDYDTLDDLLATYDNLDAWLTQNNDGTYSVTDLAGFINGTNFARNKNIPGFDTLANDAENTAFGTPDMEASHYSASVAAVLKENYSTYENLDGFNAEQVDLYIEQANDEYVINQAYLMNATEIMLNVANGTETATPSTYWRTRNGTADQHTSFTIAYNLCLAAMANDYDVDYSLVWDMGHGYEEGTTTGTFIEWVNEICAAAEEPDDDTPSADMPEALTFWGETYEWEYVPAVENESYQGLDLTAVAYYKIFNVPYIENAPVYTYGSNETVVQKINIFVPAAYFENGDWSGTVNGYTIDTAPIIYKNSNSGWNTGLPQKGFQYVWEDNGNLAVEDGDCLENGFIYITVGSRGRNIASAPAMIADLKAGVRFLKANADQIPGDTEKIVSIADSGGGAASSLVGATGDMAEYYPYLYEIGALGVEWIGTTPYDSASDEEKADTTNYKSTISDAVYAAMMYCPILDLNNADLAYAWMHFDDGITQMVGWGGYTTFTDYQLQLQNDLAVSFIDYVNGLELLRPYSGEVLVLDDGEDGTTLGDARDGTYYQAVLDEMSKALTAYIANEEWKTQNTAGYSLPFTYPYADCVDATDYLMTAYGDYNEGTPDTWDWLEIDGDVYTITDMGAFIRGTDLGRNKNITAFDALNRGGEGNIVGDDNVYEVNGETIVDDGNSSEVANADAVTVVSTPTYHISRATADVIESNMADGLSGDTYSTYEEWLYMLWNHSSNESTAVTFNDDDNGWKMEFDGGDFEALVTEQSWLYNVTTILQDYIDAKENGTLSEMATPEGPTVAQHWRSRNGTADYHTSFTVAYNLYLTMLEYGAVMDQPLTYDYSLVWGMNHGWTEGTSTGTFAEWVKEIAPANVNDTPKAYVVTFNANGGSVDTTSVLTDTDGMLSVLPTPTRSGYSFDGWYTAASGGTEITADSAITESTTLYAQWNRNSGGGGGGSSSSSTSTTTTTTTTTTTSTGMFSDVSTSAYYYDAVEWAVENAITTGTSATTFEPEIGCTRAQVVTFLWRAAGSPETESENPFTDVADDVYYYDAVLWAVANGITTGTSGTSFSPDDTCTRAQIVTFMHRSADNTTSEATESFSDVDLSAYYAAAVSWAVDNGVTTGTSDTTFSPNDTCTRAQVVTFLYRYYAA